MANSIRLSKVQHVLSPTRRLVAMPAIRVVRLFAYELEDRHLYRVCLTFDVDDSIEWVAFDQAGSPYTLYCRAFAPITQISASACVEALRLRYLLVGPGLSSAFFTIARATLRLFAFHLPLTVTPRLQAYR